MGWHLPFDRTERLLTRGQHALQRRDWTQAEALLRQALERDPDYAHIHLYLAQALAEQGRLAEAERALARGGQLAPGSFVFPLHLAIVRLDADDTAGALAALQSAARLAPDNPLVAGYAELARWNGAPEGAAALARRGRDLPESFRARLLLRVLDATLTTRGPHMALKLLEPAFEPPIGLTLPPGLRARWRRGRIARAQRLVDDGRLEDAADHLTAQPDALEEPGAAALLERARRGAVRELTETSKKADAPARRALLLRRYEHENALGDRDAAFATLAAWRQEMEAAGTPRREAHMVAEVTRRMAELDIERGAPAQALQHIAASRAARPSRETDGVEAVAFLALGRRRAARHRFEDFLADALFDVEASVGRLRSPA